MILFQWPRLFFSQIKGYDTTISHNTRKTKVGGKSSYSRSQSTKTNKEILTSSGLAITFKTCNAKKWGLSKDEFWQLKWYRCAVIGGVDCRSRYWTYRTGEHGDAQRASCFSKLPQYLLVWLVQPWAGLQHMINYSVQHLRFEGIKSVSNMFPGSNSLE